MARYIKLQRLPNETSTPGLRKLEEKDCEEAHNLLNAYLSKLKLRIQFNLEEFKHFFLPREWVIESYVVLDGNNAITDFISFYSLPSSILKHPEHKILNVAYSYYNVPGQYTMTQLMKDALILARNKGYDVFNALDVQQNLEVFKELNFGVGDGNLHYYLYNWRIQKLDPKDLGMVLV